VRREKVSLQHMYQPMVALANSRQYYLILGSTEICKVLQCIRKICRMQAF
jgi:hypothetical protein